MSPAGNRVVRRSATIVAAFLCLGAAFPSVSASAPELEVVSQTSLPSGSGPSTQFDGVVGIRSLVSAHGPSRVSVTAVSFDPGARSGWHTHPLGQLVIVTAGRGYVQAWGAPLQEIETGDVIRIPPGVKHWHGARLGQSMAQITVQEARGNVSTTWLEKTSDGNRLGAKTARPR